MAFPQQGGARVASPSLLSEVAVARMRTHWPRHGTKVVQGE